MTTTFNMSSTDLKTITLLNERLSYDPATGIFTWKQGGKNIYKGTQAGSLTSSGYRVIKVAGKAYKEHRLVWFLTYGYWPTVIDHINQDRSDNRLCNLREVTHAENARNKSYDTSKTVTGHVGIIWLPKEFRYAAVIRKNGKCVYKRRFKTCNEAIAAREAALQELGFHDNHGSEKQPKP